MNIAPASQSLIFRPESWVERLRVDGLFSEARPLEVELGAGDGSFIAQWAERNPGRNFLAVERLLGRLRKIDRKGQRRGLRNLRVLRIEAGYFVEFLLPRGSVSALHLYFPDPWPKRKHRRHRLVNEQFAGAVARALAPGGVVWLRTDDEDYFAQMVSVFGGAKDFSPVETPLELAEVVTDFEREFNARGVATRRAGYVRSKT